MAGLNQPRASIATGNSSTSAIATFMALGDQRLGDRQADAARRAGDESFLAGQFAERYLSNQRARRPTSSRAGEAKLCLVGWP